MRFLNFQREPKDKLPVNLLETVMVSSGTHLVQCSTLMLVHWPRISENSCWASKSVLLLAPRPVH